MIFRSLVCLLLAGLTASAIAADQPNPEPAVVLNLNGAITDPDQIDYDHLPRIEGTHGVICPAEADWKFQLHNYLLHRDGKYWCIWSHGPGEDQPTQHVRYATSEDGVIWSPSKHLTPDPAEGHGYIARGLWVRDGEMLALVASYKGQGAFGVDKELQLQAYAWDAAAGDWKFKGKLYDDAINNFPPQQLADGRWIMSRRDSRFNVYMLVGGVKALDDWESFPVIKRLAIPKFAPDEPFSWMLPDGRIHGLFRDNGGSSRLFQAFSSDQGRTWTLPRITNFPNSSSKFFALQLSSGPWVMISNANPKWGRRELHLSLSDDGLTFTKMARLEIPMKRATTFQYPHALEHDGHLLIAFSALKNQSEVLKVPLAAITALHDGPVAK
jgi:hypothetical protein